MDHITTSSIGLRLVGLFSSTLFFSECTGNYCTGCFSCFKIDSFSSTEFGIIDWTQNTAFAPMNSALRYLRKNSCEEAEEVTGGSVDRQVK
jgi:hypothetical protein